MHLNTDSGNSSAKVAEEDAASAIPDLSRRNTIVPPPSLEEVEQDMENIEEGIIIPSAIRQLLPLTNSSSRLFGRRSGPRER